MSALRSETRLIVQGCAQAALAVTDDRRDGSGPWTGRQDCERTLMDIDATRGLGLGTHARRTEGARPAPAGEFARVFDLAEARRKRMTRADRIPEEVWDDIHRAGELADDLAARGQQVRFDSHRLTGRVVASLCDTDGRMLRPVSLRDVLGTEPDPAPAA
jgi:hypothetical protein